MTQLVRWKDLESNFGSNLGYNDNEDAGDILFLSTRSFVEKNNDSDDVTIHSISTDQSLDLHGEAMDGKFVKNMVKQANAMIKTRKYFPQFSNHMFNWENMIAFAYSVWYENNAMHLRSIPNYDHPLAKRLVSMLNKNAPIDNSIVIARVKYEDRKVKDENGNEKTVLTYTDGRIKSSDFVGIGANENTSARIDKSVNNSHGCDNMTEKNLGAQSAPEGTDSSNKGESASGQVPPDHSKKLDELEQKIKALTDTTVKAMQDAIQNSMKTITDNVDSKLKELVINEVKNALENRKQSALVKLGIDNTQTQQKNTKNIVEAIENITDKKTLNDLMAAFMRAAADNSTNQNVLGDY